MKVTALDETVIRDIGHAFGYYDYSTEHGLIDAFPSREAAAAFICGYVRMALQSGMLYATGERGEGYIAYKLPGQKVSIKDEIPLARALLGSMRIGDLIRFMRIWQRAARGSANSLTRQRNHTSMSVWFVSENRIRDRAICGR